MRTRTDGVLTPMPPVFEHSSTGGVIGPIYGTARYGQTKSISDVVTPNYARRVRMGEVFFNPLDVRAVENSVTGSGYVSRNNSSGVTYELSGAPEVWIPSVFGLNATKTPVISRSLSDWEISQLVTEVATAVRGSRGRSRAESWETLAQIDKTSAMLRKPIASWWRQWRRNEHKWATTANSVANGYLMWRYGLRPLIMDVSQILKDLHNGPDLLPHRVTTRKSQQIVGTSDTHKVSSHGIFNIGWNARNMEMVKVRGMSLDVDTVELQDILGLSGKNLATLPYQLIRYSFVADWFVNVGDYLSALADVFFSNKNLGGCVTVERWLSTTVSIASCTSNQSGWSVIRPPTVENSVTEYTKTRTTYLPVPGLAIRGDFRLDNVTRAADALALIGQKVLPKLARAMHPEVRRRETN